jgi:hypothetical protein
MSTAIAERRISLYEIEAGLSELMQAREEAEGPEEVAAVEQAIQEYVSREVKKVDGIRSYIKYAQMAQSDAAKAAEVWGQRIERLKGMVKGIMEATGQKRLNGVTGYFMLKGNGGLAPLNIQDDVLPDEYRNITVTMPLDIWNAAVMQIGGIPQAGPGRIEPANTRIREALKEGAVPGAWLEDRGQHIEVR